MAFPKIIGHFLAKVPTCPLQREQSRDEWRPNVGTFLAPFVPKRKEMEADGEEEVEQGDQDGGGEAAEEVADEAGLEDEGGGEADGQGLGEVREVKRKKEKKERRMKKRKKQKERRMKKRKKKKLKERRMKKWDEKIEDGEGMNAQ